MQIHRLLMTRKHYAEGGNRRRLVVLHSTAGVGPGDLNWLRNGGSTDRPVSCHYYISKTGRITQLVDDDDIAWHAGESTWIVDGKRVHGCNAVSLGIELENRNTGLDPYPAPQVAAALWLTQRLTTQYRIPQSQLVRHLDIAPGRKTDPAGFPWPQFVASVYAPPPAIPVTADAPILSAPRCSLEQAQKTFAKRGFSNGYTSADVLGVILPAYFNACAPLDLDPAVAVAQMAHETGWLTSFWSARPQRNPAGIGVNGEAYPHKPANASGFRYNAQRRMWERGLSFGGWLSDSIPAHLGRLLAYVLPPGHGTPEQRAAVNRALAYRPLPEVVRGSAETLKQLGRVHNKSGVGWASPGTLYGQALAKVINEMRAQ